MTLQDPTTPETMHVLKSVSQLSFSWYDYILFCVMLAVSALIGVYFGCFGTKQSSVGEYLMGNKKMKVVPVSVSLIASHISGITLLATPADTYRYGASYGLVVLCALIVAVITLYVYLPVFFKLQVTSTYEYLERRFDSTNRMFASFLFALGVFFYLPIVIYVPALAFSAATGINVHYITPVVCGVCIFYTTLGGLKAVVWTDTLQFTVTSGAVMTVVIIGIKAAGGVGAIMSRAVEGHRLDIFDFDPNPIKRDSFWIVVIGMSIHWLAGSAIHQSCVQKYLSVPTFRESKLTVIFFWMGIAFVCSFSVFTGLIMYSRYYSCDPFTTGVVRKNDQLLPYYIMDVASHIPGLSGLFIAGVFCAALSTLSACLNCLAGTVFEDFVLKFTGPLKNERTGALILKVLVVICGVACTVLVLVVEKLGGILPLAISLGGVTAGPLMGMFTLGVLFPRASSKGAFYGSIIGLLVAGYVAMMAQYYKAEGIIVDKPKPTSTDGCLLVINTTHNDFSSTLVTTLSSLDQWENETENIFSKVMEENGEATKDEPFFLFRMSFYYYTAFGTLITLISGLLVSYLFKNDDPPVHRDLLSPVIYFMLPDEKIMNENIREYYSLDKALLRVTVNSQNDNPDEIKT